MIVLKQVFTRQFWVTEESQCFISALRQGLWFPLPHCLPAPVGQPEPWAAPGMALPEAAGRATFCSHPTSLHCFPGFPLLLLLHTQLSSPQREAWLSPPNNQGQQKAETRRKDEIMKGVWRGFEEAPQCQFAVLIQAFVNVVLTQYGLRLFFFFFFAGWILLTIV